MPLAVGYNQASKQFLMGINSGYTPFFYFLINNHDKKILWSLIFHFYFFDLLSLALPLFFVHLLLSLAHPLSLAHAQALSHVGKQDQDHLFNELDPLPRATRIAIPIVTKQQAAEMRRVEEQRKET